MSDPPSFHRGNEASFTVSKNTFITHKLSHEDLLRGGPFCITYTSRQAQLSSLGMPWEPELGPCYVRVPHTCRLFLLLLFYSQIQSAQLPYLKHLALTAKTEKQVLQVLNAVHHGISVTTL